VLGRAAHHLLGMDGDIDFHPQKVRCIPGEAARNRDGLFGLDDEGEDIRAFVVPGNEVEDLLASGRITNATAVIALQWFLLNRDRLRRLWLD